jgi:hypothetical protein
VVDRLEKAGLVLRERDEGGDRRKVFLAIVPERTSPKVGRISTGCSAVAGRGERIRTPSSS